MKLSGDRNQCPTCQEYFNSSSSFDYHRVGGYSPLNTRTCLTPSEMTSRGMSKNKDGFWIQKAYQKYLSEPDVMPKWPFARVG